VTQLMDKDHEKLWRCGWCKKDFSGWNATKTLAHLTKQSKQDIWTCGGRIDDEHAETYSILSWRSFKRRDRSRESNEAIDSLLM
jgi:hypothetical protein